MFVFYILQYCTLIFLPFLRVCNARLMDSKCSITIIIIFLLSLSIKRAKSFIYNLIVCLFSSISLCERRVTMTTLEHSLKQYFSSVTYVVLCCFFWIKIIYYFTLFSSSSNNNNNSSE